MKSYAVLYLRMSTLAQDKSIAQQREEILTKFGNEVEILREYIDEGRSGSVDQDKRTEFLRMLADCGKEEFEYVLCYDLSRFNRQDNIEGAFAKKILRDNEVKLLTVTEGEIDWSTMEGRIVDAVRTEQHHAYSVKISKEGLRGKRDNAKRGDPYGQLTPYGLARLVFDPQGKEYVIPRMERFRKPRGWKQRYIPGDDDEVAVVRWLFAEYFQRDASYHQLARALNDRNVPSPNGGRWVYQVIHELLKNVRYCGDLSLGVESAGTFHRLNEGEIVPTGGRKGRKHNKSPLLAENTHQGIIERSVFDAVQEKMKRREKTGQHSQREEGFALTGVLICGHCGKPMYGVERKDPSRHRVGVHYRCKGWHRHYDSKCGQWGVHQDDVLPFLVRVIAEEVDKTLLENVKPQPPKPRCDRENVEKRLIRLQCEYDVGISRLLKIEDERLAADVESRLKAVRDEIGRLEEELAKPATSDDVEASRKWWMEIRSQLVVLKGCIVQGPRSSFSKPGSIYSTPSIIRELFLKMACRVTCWYEQAKRRDGSPARRYHLARGRIQAGDAYSRDFDAAHFDSPASLIVWCGERNGRTANSGCPGFNRPTAL